MLEDDVFGVMYGALKGRLEEFGGWKEERDSVVWIGKTAADKVFSVASCYDFYMRHRIPFGPCNKSDEAFGLLWKTEVPFKIKSFDWRLFHNRLPTKDLLLCRGMSIPLDSLNCVLCGNCEETIKHFFFSCSVVKKVWVEVALWVDKGETNVYDCMANFLDWYSFFRLKKVKEGKLGVVLLATSWTLWILSNGVCFRKDKWSVNDIVWNMKLLV
ncbi:uncharacterized protein LOC131605312 [Vicia villosa]|uniref:uncharacterized protein LOC131605312 n=1 Tax=Vicia villosa TaxID=3911 RepID=UPI00273BEED3|nr:uncharacterized protein LOC131605312 [Vicia villosa]